MNVSSLPLRCFLQGDLPCFLLIDLHPESETIRIPNEEIRIEFGDTLRDMKFPDTIRRVQESDKLIQDAAYMRSDEVAKAIEKIHREEFEPRHYNNEQSLRIK